MTRSCLNTLRLVLTEEAEHTSRYIDIVNYALVFQMARTIDLAGHQGRKCI